MKFPFFLVTISGESMWPELISGKTYCAYAYKKPRIHDAIVFIHPHKKISMVKKITEITSSGYKVLSTVSWGNSSTTLGVIPHSAVRGVVIKHIRFPIIKEYIRNKG